jgi:hypothetical protein
MERTLNIQTAIGQLVTAISAIVALIPSIIGLLVMLIVVGTVANEIDLLKNRWLPSMGATELAYLCGAYWLWSKAR